MKQTERSELAPWAKEMQDGCLDPMGLGRDTASGQCTASGQLGAGESAASASGQKRTATDQASGQVEASG